MNTTNVRKWNFTMPFWLGGWKTYWVLGAGLYFVIYTLWIFFKWGGPEYETWIAGFGYLPLGLFCAISGAYTAFQDHLESRIRNAWKFIAASVICLALADIIYVAIELSLGEIPFPNISDVFYLAYYPLLLIGFISIPTRIADPSQRKTWVFDFATIIVTITGIFWYYIIAPTAVAGGEDWAAILVAGAYPTMDIVVLGGIISLLYRNTVPSIRQSLYILGVGMFIYILADIAYAILYFDDLYVSGSWVDVLWTLSYFIIGISAFRQAEPEHYRDDWEIHSRINWQTTLIPFMAVSISSILTLYVASSQDEQGIPLIGLLVGTAIGVVLTTARQVITIRENSRLLEEVNTYSNQARHNSENLERLVNTRTRELERVSNELRLVSEIVRDVGTSNNLGEMLRRSTSQIVKGFKYRYAAIYLVAARGDFVELAASFDALGEQQSDRNAKIRVGDAGIVGKTAATGEIHLNSEGQVLRALQIQSSSSTSKSEIALPLKSEGKIIGTLLIHSDRSEAFAQDDVHIMQLLADQLASTIERIRLLEETARNYTELENAYGQSTRDSWHQFTTATKNQNRGYRFDNVRIEALANLTESGREVLKTGKAVKLSGTEANQEIALPVKLRGQTIGVVNAKLREGYSPDTIAVLELAIDRLASSLESARLYEEARIRADREQAISQITTAIGSSSSYEAILRTTVREIGLAMPDTEVSIQIVPEPPVQQAST